MKYMQIVQKQFLCILATKYHQAFPHKGGWLTSTRNLQARESNKSSINLSSYTTCSIINIRKEIKKLHPEYTTKDEREQIFIFFLPDVQKFLLIDWNISHIRIRQIGRKEDFTGGFPYVFKIDHEQLCGSNTFTVMRKQKKN